LTVLMLVVVVVVWLLVRCRERRHIVPQQVLIWPPKWRGVATEVARRIEHLSRVDFICDSGLSATVGVPQANAAAHLNSVIVKESPIRSPKKHLLHRGR
jgi:hypothetical protein